MTVTVDTGPITVEVTDGVTTGGLQAERNARIAGDALLIPLAQKGVASGVATLDGAGTVPDAQIPASIARDTEVSTAVAAAVAALVASAPGTLDTLNELAAALANDPSFATTITTALAGKQPLDADLTAIAALTTTTFGRSLLALANAAAGRTALGLGTAATANTGDFDPAGAATAAVAALVNSSPATLDTLNELAAALGDDPNFATTIAGQIIPVGSDRWLRMHAADPDKIIVGAVTRDSNEAATGAGVVWPDGTVGTYTATTVSSAFPGAVDAYTVTYGSPVTKTVTQSAVTRDAAGAVTVRPALTVA